MSEYDFDTQLTKGENYEKILDKHYSKKFDISVVDMKFQRMGIDRIWVSKSGYRYLVEYKSDEKATQTENIFVETISVDKDNKLGWAYTSCAQILVYYLPLSNIAYHISLLTLKFSINKWKKFYEAREIQNDGYLTIGIIVPIKVFEKKCFYIDENVRMDNNNG